MSRTKKPKKKIKNIDALKLISTGIKNLVLVDHMQEEKIVPTLLTGYNRAMKIGGYPLGGMTIVHGPNQVGKTVFALAVAESLRKFGHPSVIFDAEFAAEKEWYSAITPKSGYMKISDLDLLISNCQKMLDNLKKAKKEELISKDVGCCFVVDTLTKLMPAEVLEKIESKGVEKMYPLQAAWVSAWSKSIIPQLYDSNSTMILVLQERSNIGAMPGQKKYKATLGNAVQYDNRCRVRVPYSKPIKKGEIIVGYECHASLENNKISGTAREEFKYYTSNGLGDIPKGLDLVREAVEEAKTREVLKKVKRNDESYIEAKFEDDEESLFLIKGGWKDVMNKLEEDKKLFKAFVDSLNSNI